MKNAAIRRSNQLLGISTSWTKIWPPEKVEFRSHEIRPPDPEPMFIIIVFSQQTGKQYIISAIYAKTKNLTKVFFKRKWFFVQDRQTNDIFIFVRKIHFRIRLLEWLSLPCRPLYDQPETTLSPIANQSKTNETAIFSFTF